MRSIVFVVNIDWFFASHRLPIAIALMKSGFKVHLVCRFTTYQAYFEELGIVTHSLDISRGGMSLVKEFRSLYKLYWLVKCIKPDLVHLVTIKPVTYGSLVARLLGIRKVVVSISGLGFVFIDDSIKARVIRSFVIYFYRLGLSVKNVSVIFQNTSDLKLFLDHNIVCDSQAFLIRGSGVDLNYFRFTAEPDGSPVVMFLARFLKDKGIVEFVEASSIVKALFPSARFVVVGNVDSDNPNSILPADLDRWVELGLVEDWGYSSDVFSAIRQSNLMVLPSYREGLPKSLLEAAACGRAVITTDVPGCREAIISGETGLLVYPRNSRSLADAIVQLLQDGQLRKKFGAAGRLYAENYFDVNSIVSQHLSIYLESSDR